jgi:GTPase
LEYFISVKLEKGSDKMNKEHLALVGVVIALAVILSVVSIYVVYVDTPANQFEQKLKNIPSPDKEIPAVEFVSMTQAELNENLKTYTDQTQFEKVSESQFIQEIQNNNRDGYTSFIARLDNTFYLMAEGQTSVCCTP